MAVTRSNKRKNHKTSTQKSQEAIKNKNYNRSQSIQQQKILTAASWHKNDKFITSYIPQRCGDGRNNLANQAVQICIGRSLNIQVATTNVIDCLIVHHESAV